MICHEGLTKATSLVRFGNAKDKDTELSILWSEPNTLRCGTMVMGQSLWACSPIIVRASAPEEPLAR